MAVTDFFSFTWSGAFNRAIYADFRNAPCPADIAAQVNAAGAVVGPFQCSLTGKQLPYAPKFASRSNSKNRLPPFLLPLHLAVLMFRSFRDSPEKTQTAHAAVGENVETRIIHSTAILNFINKNVPRVRLKFGVR